MSDELSNQDCLAMVYAQVEGGRVDTEGRVSGSVIIGYVEDVDSGAP